MRRLLERQNIGEKTSQRLNISLKTFKKERLSVEAITNDRIPVRRLSQKADRRLEYLTRDNLSVEILHKR